MAPIRTNRTCSNRLALDAAAYGRPGTVVELASVRQAWFPFVRGSQVDKVRDSRMTAPTVASLLHGGRIACVRRGLVNRLRLGLVGVIGDDGCFVEIDLDGAHPGTFSSDFFDW